MKYFKILFVAAALLVCSPATAESVYVDRDSSEYTFQKHFYLQLQGGVQHTLGEGKFFKFLAPNFQAAFGWQFHPLVGARFSVGAFQSKGGFNGYQPDKSVAPGTCVYSWNYIAPAVDVTFDLTNAIWGYNPFRLVDVKAFVGGALNIGFGNDDANEIAKQGYSMRLLWDGTKVRPVGRVGASVDFRLTDMISVGAEANANVLADGYNSKKADNSDWYFNALVGVKINLGKTYKKKAKEIPVVKPIPSEPVVEQPATQKVVEEPVVEQPETKSAQEVNEPLRRDIFYSINVTYITPAEKSKIDDIVAYMKKYPKSKVTVTGYADKGTGTLAVNDRIAAKRASTVADTLVKAGISRSRIKVDSKGSRVQPFAKNNKNRVSICIAE